MHRDGARVFVEFGPLSTLGKLVRKILPQADPKATGADEVCAFVFERRNLRGSVVGVRVK